MSTRTLVESDFCYEKAAFPEIDVLIVVSFLHLHTRRATRDSLCLLSTVSIKSLSIERTSPSLPYFELMMHASIYLLSSLLASLHPAVADIPSPFQALSQPQRPVSFSPPSQHPILVDLPASTAESFSRNGTINIAYCTLQPSIPVTYSLSSHICVPLIPELPYIISDLTQRLLSEHIDGAVFPVSSDSHQSPLPVYIGANITEQIYRSRFVLGLSLNLSPRKDSSKDIDATRWRSIIGVLEQTALELDREARKSNGVGLGNVLTLDVDVEDIHIFAEWRFWKVVDGEASMCQSESR